MGLRHICREAERLPNWYGVAYRGNDPDHDEWWGDSVRVCYPIPLNLVVRLWHVVWHILWRVVKCPHRFWPGFDIHSAYRCRELEQENDLLKSDLEWEKTMNQSLAESRRRASDEIERLRDRVRNLELDQRFRRLR